MDIVTNNFTSFIGNAKKELIVQHEIAVKLKCDEFTINALGKVVELIVMLEDKVNQGKLKINYLIHFQSSIENMLSAFPHRGHQESSFVEYQTDQWKIQAKSILERNSQNISGLYEQLEFNLHFFDKIGYFDSNVVAIGANGSGKTILSNKFKAYLHNNGVVISAQRILLVPSFASIANPEKTASELKEYQLRNKTCKSDSEFRYLQQEFGVVLKNLLADNISEGNAYRIKALKAVKSGKDIEPPRLTKLDITFRIWNSLIKHRTISCDDSMNIIAKTTEGSSYPAIQMSDGEKVMLYLIAQVLQAPKDGFIVVDEPEMYLHKTILEKLWDILEAKRPDCIFIYLTHDLDFATSRTTAKKIWIKSFTHPNKWEIEDIPRDEIPEALMLELLGSRKDILFVEGVKGSIDERLYSILFPELTIVPVGSCFDVINLTKAFNRLRNIKTNAYGLIDTDHHNSARLSKLRADNVYSIQVAEVENLFLDADFLKILMEQLLVDKVKIESIKQDVINELEKTKELQASNYVSAKVNYYFTDSDVSKGNSLADLEDNFQKFLDQISINDWYLSRLSELNEMIKASDYDKILMSFNNKGLNRIACKHLKISDFTIRCIKLLQVNDEARSVLEKYFPDEIKVVGKTVSQE